MALGHEKAIDTVVFCGLPGSGKTTLAEALSSEINGAVHFNTQRYRLELTNNMPTYTPEEHSYVQACIEADVIHTLSNDGVALIDTRLTRSFEHRHYWHELSRALGKTSLSLFIATPATLASTRAEDRITTSDGLYTRSSRDTLVTINRLFEAPPPSEPSIVLDGTLAPQRLTQAALLALKY